MIQSESRSATLTLEGSPVFRNVVTSVLPPHRTVMIKVKPPISTMEQPMVLTLSRHGLAITQVSSDLVQIQNQTDRVKPICFYVAPRGFSLGGAIQTVKALLGGT
jgi:hypothetical protein